SNPLGAPDVMRGEETQLVGALEIEPALAAGRHLVCMPGTHTKWVSMRDGIVQEFLTVPTGEVFALLCNHSVLVHDAATPVYLVGTPQLCANYSLALARRGRKALVVDGTEAALRGQAFVYRALESASA